MKEPFLYGGDDILAVLSTLVLLLPMAAIAFRRSMWHACFGALAVYYFQFFVFSLFTNEYLSASGGVLELVKFSHVFIDLPLVLLFMQYFTENRRTRTWIRAGLLAWVLLGIVLTVTMGLSFRMIPYLMGPGLLLAAIISMAFFVKYLKSGIHHRWETGKAFMAGSLVFLYGSYLVIFFIQFVMDLRDEEEIYLLFQLTTILSALLMTIGLLLNRKRPERAPVDEKTRDRDIILTNWGDFQFK